MVNFWLLIGSLFFTFGVVHTIELIIPPIFGRILIGKDYKLVLAYDKYKNSKLKLEALLGKQDKQGGVGSNNPRSD